LGHAGSAAHDGGGPGSRFWARRSRWPTLRWPQGSRRR
jgi:hypothetical protein